MGHEWWFDVPGAIVVAAVSTLNIVLGAVVGVFGAQINDSVLASVALFVLATGTGIIGWSLVMVVKLSSVVAKLESTAEDHERRLSRGDL